MKKHISLSLLLSVALTGFAWADNAIETLPSGVKVEHLKPGAGASPTAADTVVAQDETNRSLSREAAELRVRVEAMETELRIARGAAGELEQLKRQLTAALDAHRQVEQSASDAQASAAAELAALREELSSRSVDLEAAVRESVECHDGRALIASDDL